MGYRESRYRSGETICPGDRVTLAGRSGLVLFVMGSSGNPDDFDGWPGWLAGTEGGGFMLDVEGVGWVFQREGDEDLELIQRSTSQ